MNFETFERYISAIIKVHNYVDEMVKVTNKYYNQSYTPIVLLEEQVVDLLEYIFDDQETHWISYWLYELDCGKLYKKGCVTFDGKDFPLATIEDLYKLLTD